MKTNALKVKYDREIQAQKLKRFSNSSYMTPDSFAYLNEIVQNNQSKVDEEIVYAGLQNHTKGKMTFKNNEKFASKYKKERQNKRKRKGRFG